MLGWCGNTLTADPMYSGHRWERFPQQVQTILSQKLRTFSAIFIAFLESAHNFPHFEKKHHLHSLNISEVTDPDKYGYFDARNLLF